MGDPSSSSSSPPPAAAAAPVVPAAPTSPATSAGNQQAVMETKSTATPTVPPAPTSLADTSSSAPSSSGGAVVAAATTAATVTAATNKAISPVPPSSTTTTSAAATTSATVAVVDASVTAVTPPNPANSSSIATPSLSTSKSSTTTTAAKATSVAVNVASATATAINTNKNSSSSSSTIIGSTSNNKNSTISSSTTTTTSTTKQNKSNNSNIHSSNKNATSNNSSSSSNKNTTATKSNSKNNNNNNNSNNNNNNWENIKIRLLSTHSHSIPSLTTAIQTISELRDRMEVVHTTEYSHLLMNLIPAFRAILVSPASSGGGGIGIGGKSKSVSSGSSNKSSKTGSGSIGGGTAAAAAAAAMTKGIPVSSCYTPSCYTPPTPHSSSSFSSSSASSSAHTPNSPQKTQQQQTQIQTQTQTQIQTTQQHELKTLQQKLRHSTLEFLSHLPHNELFRSHAPHVLGIAMSVLLNDYEENAMVASGMIFHLFKSFRVAMVGGDNKAGTSSSSVAGAPGGGGEVQRFLDFVGECYRGLAVGKGNVVVRNFDFSGMMTGDAPATSTSAASISPAVSAIVGGTPAMAAVVKKELPATTTATDATTATATAKDSTAATPMAGITPTPASAPTSSLSSPTPIQQQQHPTMLKSNASFRVLTECPLTVMLLFQLYPKFLKTNIPILIPLMMDALKLCPPPPPSRPGSSSEGTTQQGVSPASTLLAVPPSPLDATCGTPSSSSPPKITATPNNESGAPTPIAPDSTKSKGDSITGKNDQSSSSSSDYDTIIRLYHTRARELVAAQVKTLSFLTYLLRGFTDQMRPYEELMAQNVVSLMRNCPRDAVSTRKELLVATRHILATDFRRGFFRHVDAMLDERILVGTLRHSSASSSAEQASLRPLGYSTLADLVHHVRRQLTPAQLSRVVRIFSRVLHDVSMAMPLSMQITSVRLLLHLVDQIFTNKDPNPQVGRDLLVRIFNTLIQKFVTVKDRAEDLMEAVKKELKEQMGKDDNADPFEKRRKRGDFISFTGFDAGLEDDYMVEGNNQNSPSAMLRDVQLLLRPMVQGMKTLIWCINSYSHQREKERQRATKEGEQPFPLPAFATSKDNDEVSSAILKMTQGERELVHQLIISGLPCLRLFRLSVEKDPSTLENDAKSKSLLSAPAPPRHREMLEAFAASFTVLESYNFRRTMAPNLPFILDEMDKDKDVIAFLKHLLLASGKAVSYEFCEILVIFLMTNISGLGEYETQTQVLQHNSLIETGSDASTLASPPTTFSKRAHNLFALFNLIFSSLNKFPKNEVALRPYLQKLISECLRRSTEGPMYGPGPYMNMLRSLFRTMSGGKFEESYKELPPLIPTILNGLFRIYTLTEDDAPRLVIVELCLTIPARLSILLPHLSLIVKLGLIPALQSNKGDLINLGLRTLEFWIDNLSPDYLFPILTQQSSTMCELMVSLTRHLQPAPYPYGLLCLRILGKLGGKNRLFVQELMSVDSKAENFDDNLAMFCEWNSRPHGTDTNKDKIHGTHSSFLLPFPLKHAVDVLRCVSAAPILITEGEKSEGKTKSLPETSFQNDYLHVLLTGKAENFDLNSFSVDLMEKVKTEQSKCAFAVIRAALASVLDIPKVALCVSMVTETLSLKEDQASAGTIDNPQQSQSYNSAFKIICDGLFAAEVHENLQQEAIMLLKGLAEHIFYIVVNHRDHITRIDSDGGDIDPFHQAAPTDDTSYEAHNHISDGKMQPLKPFGAFRLSGPLDGGIDPFVFNESLVHAFSDTAMKKNHSTASGILSYIFKLFKQINGVIAEDLASPNDDNDTVCPKQNSQSSLGDILFENLLSQFCQLCFSKAWNFRSGLMTGMLELMNKMGVQWCKQYEVEILHTAIFVVKDAPSDISHAGKESMKFLLGCSWFFFGGPQSWKEFNPLIHDILCPTRPHKPSTTLEEKAISISEASLTLILSEVQSTKHLVRFAVRHVLRMITRDNPSLDALLSKHANSLKRLLFPRLLRTLPLPDQVAVVDALAFIVDRAPSLLPITDQNLLAFLSELLKMVSIADGEISDAGFSSVVLIDKNGYAVNGTAESTNKKKSSVRASSIFYSSGFTLEDNSFGGRILVPAELPLGIQLRVSTLLLFRALIRGFPDEFFDADAQTQVGNIRPHVVSLLFRSLISEPTEAVSASSSALHDALLLGVTDNNSIEGSVTKSHRLPKELIQTCIRPILLHLRDHTKLNIPLLRGLSRLLALLSSWFNRTLGEKLLEHLYKFTDPDTIIAAQLWTPGEEPLVAAAVFGLFSLLPQASQFVEALVKTTIRLEAVLPRYKPCQSISPFREPLAKYLNRHCASAAGFFLEEHRLCNPMYSDLFRDILKLDEAAALRKHVSGKECTLMLLNVCFERPLAIIRSEKNSSAPTGQTSSSSLAVYGINQWNSPSSQRKLEVARQDIEMKQKYLLLKVQEESRAEKALKSKQADSKSSAKPPTSQSDNQIALLQASESTRQAVDLARKELEESRKAYSYEVSKASFQSTRDTDNSTQRPMTTSALELQHQGFKIVDALISLDHTYLQEHNDVVRAFRWLWRSRGRHYRLLHEEEMPPRYHYESSILANFLISYSKSNPTDVDVLFDLIRIFLQPSSIDFSFIKQFLKETVSGVLSTEQKGQVMQRFLTLLSSEGSEETKILSLQLLVIPMLRNAFQGAPENSKASSASAIEPNKIIQDGSIKKLIQSISNDGLSFHSKLTCELLRLINILLEYVWEDMSEYRLDLIKYIWHILKSDDNSTKYFGYLAASRFVSVFETPPKITLQVYVSLLRAHHSTEKHMVRAALHTLVPALPKRLTQDELGNAMKYTTKVMYEEGNSLPQLAHLWDVVTRNPEVYVSHKAEFIPHMVNSLNKLGLTPNSSSENRELSVTLSKLVLSWGNTDRGQECLPTKGLGRKEKKEKKSTKGLDQSVIDTIVNFLIRTAFLNAEAKADKTHHLIKNQVMSLLKEITSTRKHCDIMPVHFERVFALCKGEAHPSTLAGDKKTQDKIGGTKSVTKTSQTNSTTPHSLTSKKDDTDVAHGTLHVCIKIFLILQCHDPSNNFLQTNVRNIFPFCFVNLASSEDTEYHQSLKDLIFHLLVDEYAQDEIISSMIILLNGAIVDAIAIHGSNNESSAQSVNRGAYLAIEVIEKACDFNNAFVESFISSLTDFAVLQAKTVSLESHDKARNTLSTAQQKAGNGRWLSATPTSGIFEAACDLGFKTAKGSKEIPLCSAKAGHLVVKEVGVLKASVRSFISCMRLIGSSNLPFKFSDKRQAFIAALIMLLDSSNILPVLMTVVAVIGKWLMTEDGQQGPLTRTEREDFLQKFVSFDYQKLPEIASNALSDMICYIVLSAYGYDSSIEQYYPFFREEHTEHNIPSCKPAKKILNKQLFQKLFTTCLLSANTHLRLWALSIFGTQIDNCVLVHQKLSSTATARGCQKGDTIDVAGIPDRCSRDILHQLLNTDYEGLGSRLWTTVFVDLLLACSKHSGGVHFGRKRSIHQIFMSGIDVHGGNTCQGHLCLNQRHSSDHAQMVNVDINEHDHGAYIEFQKAIISERNEELCGRGRCLSAIRALVHGNADVCQSVLQQCFQAAWQNLPNNEERASLIQPLERLLSRPYHAQFLRTNRSSGMNVIQSLLRLIFQLRPLPTIDTFLVESLASDYNAQIEVLSYLEGQYVALKRNGFIVDSPSQGLIKAIHRCFKAIGDDDVSISISSAMSNMSGTKFALSLDTYGFVNKSTDAYLSLIERADENDADFVPSEIELGLWEDRWVNAHKEMSQWHVIDEFASSLGNPDLMMECAWKTKNWDKVKALCATPSIIASLQEGNPITKMSEIFLAIHEGKLGEVENLHAQTAQLCLYKWQLLPSLGTGSNLHMQLLQQFQRLVELRESSQVMVETTSHSAGRTIPDLKHLLSSWRQRTPNSFEPVSVWEDLFLWRFQIFDAITTNFNFSEPGTLATLHDRPWACISLGRTARRQGLKEVSMLSLSNLTECAMDVQDAFLKLREQVVAYQCSSPDLLKGGLNLVNSTNLSFFDSRQKAELFRLKAVFLNKLNDKPSSNQAYCNAVQICPAYARAWIDWGHLCVSLSELTRKKVENQPENKQDTAKKSNQYLAQAMGCFLEAVRCDTNEQSRDHIPHCLSMLSNDGALYGNLCQTLEARGGLLPGWVWLPWIPQLLTSLCRAEARAVKAILGTIVKDHPQAVYYSLRAFFLERRDVDRSRSQDVDSKDDTPLLSVKHAEVLMSNLRKLHPVLWSKLEVILEDLIIRFRPSYEAELLATIAALLQKALSRLDSKPSDTDNSVEEQNIMESYTKTLSRISIKFFNKEKPDGSKARKAVMFHLKYASIFESDFLEMKTGPSAALHVSTSINELVEKLKKWKSMLEFQVSRVPRTCKLQEASPSLSWFSCESPDLWAGACESKSLTASNSKHEHFLSLDNVLYQASQSSALAAAQASANAVLAAANSEGLGGHEGGGAAVVEIPGQYAPTASSMLDTRPFPELHSKLIRFKPILEVVSSSTKQDQIVRRISMLGSDGKNYEFLLQPAIPYWTRTGERSSQLQYVVGKVLRRDVRACRRCLTVRPTVVIPIAQRMRMSAHENSHKNLDHIFNQIQGPKSNRLASYFQEKVNTRLRDTGEVDDQMKSKVKLEVYQDICQKLVLPNILTRFMTDTIPQAEHLYQFRKVFTSQVAANSVLQHTFAVVERTPIRFMFCNITGQMISQDFRFQYNQGLLENHNVPFRMTRNIEEFIGPFLLQGVFIPSFVSVSSAMNSKRNILEPLFHLLLRDDIISWYTSKSNARNDQKTQELELQLSDRVWKNVRFVEEHLEECSPREVKTASEEAISSNPEPIDSKVRQLLDAATNPDNLSMMPPAYQAWL